MAAAGSPWRAASGEMRARRRRRRQQRRRLRRAHRRRRPRRGPQRWESASTSCTRRSARRSADGAHALLKAVGGSPLRVGSHLPWRRRPSPGSGRRASSGTGPPPSSSASHSSGRRASACPAAPRSRRCREDACRVAAEFILRRGVFPRRSTVWPVRPTSTPPRDPRFGCPHLSRDRGNGRDAIRGRRRCRQLSSPARTRDRRHRP
jgi:hypothetical protein